MTSPAELAAKYLTKRYLRLDFYERVVAGTQYDGREPFLSVSSDAPLLERAPCIVDPIVEKARNSHCDFVLGEGRWPTFTTFASEDDRAFDPDYGLDEASSKTLDLGIAKLCEHMRLRAEARTALGNGLDCGTVASILRVLDGMLQVESVRAATATPTFNPKRRGEVVSLEIKYPYIETYYDDAEHKEKERCMLYRRVIDAKRDVVYLPGEAQQDGTDPKWEEDPNATTDHNLGFCPVVWHKMLATSCSPAEIDGRPLHQNLLDEVEAYHFSCSQHHRASFYGGDPEKYEIGASEKDGIAPTGRAAMLRVEADKQGGPHPSGSFVAGASTGAPGRIRRRGVHIVASYENPEAEVGLLTLPGDALTAIESNIDRLEKILCASMRFVNLDLETAQKAADASGVAIERVYARQLSFDDTLREDFGNGWIQCVIDMALRIVYAFGKREAAAGAIYLPGVDKIRPILAKFEKTLTDNTVRWFSPHLDLVWPPYFKPTLNDQKTAVETVATAVEKKVATRKLAVEKLKTEGVFPMASPADVADELDKADEAEAAAGAEPDEDDEAGVDPAVAGVVDGKQNAGTVVTVNELRAAMGLGSIADGDLTVAEHAAAHAAAKAQQMAVAGPPQPADGSAKADAAPPKTSTPGGDPKASPPPGPKDPAVAPKADAASPAPKPGDPPMIEPDAHQRASDGSAGIGQTIYEQLSEDYKPASIEWVKSATWRGPLLVPIEQIDFSDSNSWQATQPEDADHVQDFVDLIEKDEQTKPVILANEGNDSKFFVVDGRHRVMAYKKLGRPVIAFVGDVGGVGGAWRTMHDSQVGRKS